MTFAEEGIDKGAKVSASAEFHSTYVHM
jgi:hypothetical protein